MSEVGQLTGKFGQVARVSAAGIPSLAYARSGLYGSLHDGSCIRIEAATLSLVGSVEVVMALNCSQLARDGRCPNSSSGKSAIRTAASRRRHSNESGIGTERGAHMELLATFSHSNVRKPVIMQVGQAATQDSRTLPVAPAAILARAEG